MGTEIEAKMHLDDGPALEAILVAAGGLPGPVCHELNIFFDTAQKTLQASGQGLRLRVERRQNNSRQKVIITHKGPRTNSSLKVRSETELVVEDVCSAEALLDALGFVRVLSFEKRRRRWRLDACHVDVDHLPYLGEFVEIEGASEEAVLALREKLGLATEPLISASYAGMLKHYLTQHQMTNDHVPLTDDPRVR